MNIPYGYCHCGCGEKTNIAKQRYAKLGYEKGQPMRFVIGHSNRNSPKEFEVNKKTGCWEWQRSFNVAGYGLCYVSRITKLAHRIYYEKYIGKIPKGMYVCHQCDNKKCVNPKHLFIGTAKDNMQDALQKNRLQIGELKYNAKLNSKKVMGIRELYKQGRLSQYNIAKMYSVSRGVIFDVINRKSWKHVA